MRLRIQYVSQSDYLFAGCSLQSEYSRRILWLVNERERSNCSYYSYLTLLAAIESQVMIIRGHYRCFRLRSSQVPRLVPYSKHFSQLIVRNLRLLICYISALEVWQCIHIRPSVSYVGPSIFNQDLHLVDQAVLSRLRTIRSALEPRFQSAADPQSLQLG